MSVSVPTVWGSRIPLEERMAGKFFLIDAGWVARRHPEDPMTFCCPNCARYSKVVHITIQRYRSELVFSCYGNEGRCSYSETLSHSPSTAMSPPGMVNGFGRAGRRGPGGGGRGL